MLKRCSYRHGMPDAHDQDPLANCHGYVVLAEDGWLGDVETPLFGSDSNEPDYLVVRALAAGEARRAVVHSSLVVSVDSEDRLIHLRGSIWDLARLPATLPLAPGLNP